MVEVFKTDVYEVERSIIIVQKLLQSFPENKINFDLQDCDKILRVEGENILSGRIMELLNEEGYECKILD
ncbi:MAG: hypothetical protein ABI237_13785 [Ginsengibacter sp.]